MCSLSDFLLHIVTVNVYFCKFYLVFYKIIPFQAVAKLTFYIVI